MVSGRPLASDAIFKYTGNEDKKAARIVCMPILDYRDLEVWQYARKVVSEVYALTRLLPDAERFGLIAQMQRAAVSIAANIAEGSRRGTRRDYRQFLLHAYGSGAELETYLTICEDLHYLTSGTQRATSSLLQSVMRMLNTMISHLR